jgi:hypothetical protein
MCDIARTRRTKLDCFLTFRGCITKTTRHNQPKLQHLRIVHGIPTAVRCKPFYGLDLSCLLYGQNHGKSTLRNTQAASTGFGRGHHAPFQQSDHCMLQSKLASTACLSYSPSQSGIVQDGLSLRRLHISTNSLISSSITADCHAQCLMATARSELHGIV